LLLAIAVNPALCAIGVVHAAAIAVAVVTRLAEGTRHAGVAHAKGPRTRAPRERLFIRSS
jgi:hypothetical protein